MYAIRSYYARNTLTQRVYFDYDESAIRADAETALRAKVAILRASPEVRIRIEGHADSTGPDAYNLELSQRRADSVKRYLVQHFDIDAEHLFTEGRGENEPIATNATRAGRAKNRRAEFVNA